MDSHRDFCASVWVHGLDVGGNGDGFGADPGDFAGLRIQEFDVQNRLVMNHQPVGIHKANREFEKAAYRFRTTSETVRVRFVVLSKIGCHWQQGVVIFDDCVLNQVDRKQLDAQPVEILRDKWGIAHVYAESEPALFFGARCCR